MSYSDAEAAMLDAALGEWSPEEGFRDPKPELCYPYAYRLDLQYKKAVEEEMDKDGGFGSLTPEQLLSQYRLGQCARKLADIAKDSDGNNLTPAIFKYGLFPEVIYELVCVLHPKLKREAVKEIFLFNQREIAKGFCLEFGKIRRVRSEGINIRSLVEETNVVAKKAERCSLSS